MCCVAMFFPTNLIINLEKTNERNTMERSHFLLISAFALAVSARGQIIDIKKTAENAAINQTNQTINNEINNGVNAVFQAPGKIFRKVKANAQASQNKTATNQPVYPADNTSAAPVKAAYVTDFVPGQTVLMQDDFSTANVGDFPETWITNGSGEVRSVEGQPGKWLQLSSDGVFAPAQTKGLSENFTIEFDAIFNPNAGTDVHYIFYIYSVKNNVQDFKDTNFPGNAGVYFAFNTNAGEIDAENFENGAAGIIDLHMTTELIKSSLGNKVHIGIARQKSKLSLYLNGSRVFTSPTALPEAYTYDAIKFGSFYMTPEDFMLISNVRIAAN